MDIRLSRLYGVQWGEPSGVSRRFSGASFKPGVLWHSGLRVIEFDAGATCDVIPFGDAQVPDLLNFPMLRTAKLGGAPITDRALVILAKLPRLENLELFDTHVTDDGMKAVARMIGLKWLQLAGTSVTDKGISRLATLRNLEVIDLQATHTTSASVALIARLPNLRLIMSDGAAVAPYAQTGLANGSGKPIDLDGLAVRIYGAAQSNGKTAPEQRGH